MAGHDRRRVDRHQLAERLDPVAGIAAVAVGGRQDEQVPRRDDPGIGDDDDGVAGRVAAAEEPDMDGTLAELDLQPDDVEDLRAELTERVKRLVAVV